MSTFFEKLTGNKNKSSLPDPVDLNAQAVSKKYIRKTQIPEEEIPQHLKIKADETETAAPTEIPEEEGELTVDIYDKGDAVVIQSTVAGVKPEDLDVSITNDTVTIRGKREKQEEIADKNYYYKELFWGGFSRSVILPEEIEEDLADATLKHGLLTIRLPKRRRGIVQKLKVKVS